MLLLSSRITDKRRSWQVGDYRQAGELLDSYAEVAAIALDSLSSEERHRLYTMLRMKVIANRPGAWK